jgi:hypothetical protein
VGPRNRAKIEKRLRNKPAARGPGTAVGPGIIMVINITASESRNLDIDTEYSVYASAAF